MLKKHQSAGCWEHDGYRFLGCSRRFGGGGADFTPPDSTINAAACHKTLQRLKEVIRHKVHDFFYCTTRLDPTVLPQLWISWTSGASPPYIPNLASKIKKKAPQRSALRFQWRCSKRNQDMVTCTGRTSVYKWLDKLIYIYIYIYIAMINV
jgi:hypothetical protein